MLVHICWHCAIWGAQNPKTVSWMIFQGFSILCGVLKLHLEPWTYGFGHLLYLWELLIVVWKHFLSVPCMLHILQTIKWLRDFWLLHCSASSIQLFYFTFAHSILPSWKFGLGHDLSCPYRIPEPDCRSDFNLSNHS